MSKKTTKPEDHPYRDDAWVRDALVKVLDEFKLGRPNLRADRHGRIAFKKNVAHVGRVAVNEIAEASYTDGWKAGYSVARADMFKQVTSDSQVEAIDTLAAKRAEDARNDRPMQLGDIICVRPDLTGDEAQGGCVVAIYGTTVTFRKLDGTFDVWHDISEVQIIVKRDSHFEPEANAPLKADEFANDEESIDFLGHRIELGDRVESRGNPCCGIVVAIARDMVTFINDYDDSIGVGAAFAEPGRELRIRRSYSGGDVCDIREFVNETRAEGGAK